MRWRPLRCRWPRSLRRWAGSPDSEELNFRPASEARVGVSGSGLWRPAGARALNLLSLVSGVDTVPVGADLWAVPISALWSPSSAAAFSRGNVNLPF